MLQVGGGRGGSGERGEAGHRGWGGLGWEAGYGLLMAKAGVQGQRLCPKFVVRVVL